MDEKRGWNTMKAKVESESVLLHCFQCDCNDGPKLMTCNSLKLKQEKEASYRASHCDACIMTALKVFLNYDTLESATQQS